MILHYYLVDYYYHPALHCMHIFGRKNVVIVLLECVRANGLVIDISNVKIVK